MSTQEQSPFINIDEVLAEGLTSLLDEYATQGLRTGIRACIACLVGLGHLTTTEALSCAGALGAGEVDPLVVAQLGMRYVDAGVLEQLQGAVDSPEGTAEQARVVGLLNEAVAEMEALIAERRAEATND